MSDAWWNELGSTPDPAVVHEAELAEWRGKAALKWPEIESVVDLIDGNTESGFMETAADVARRVKGGGAPSAPAQAPTATHNHAGVPAPAGWDGGPSSASIVADVKSGKRERGAMAAGDWIAAKMAETYGDDAS